MTSLLKKPTNTLILPTGTNHSLEILHIKVTFQRMMYDFYTVNKHKLNTFFLVIRKENNSGIRLDRLSEEQVSRKFSSFLFEKISSKIDRLNDKDFADTVLNVKVWAFYDKNKGDLDVSHIFNATDVNLYLFFCVSFSSELAIAFKIFVKK